MRKTVAAVLAGRIPEKPKEIRIGLEQHARIVGAQARFIGLHGTIERKEVRILSESFSVDAIAFRIALSADLLAFGLRFGEQAGHVAIRFRSYLLAPLGPLERNSCASRCRSVCIR